MKRLSFFTLLLIVFFGCQNNKSSKASIYKFVPNQASTIVTINNSESLFSNINNNHFFSSLSSNQFYKNLSKKLSHLEYINTKKPIVLSFFKDEKDSLQFTITTRQIENLITVDSLQNYKVETVKDDKLDIKKISFNKEVLYTTFKDSVAVGASNSSLLKSVLKNKNISENRQKLINTISKTKPVSVILDNTNGNLISPFNKDELLFKTLTAFTAFDTEISQDEILFNGITKPGDSLNNLINVFKNTLPQENLIAKIAPNNCNGFISFTFNDFKTIKTNLDAFNLKKDTISTTNLFENIVEVGTIQFNEDQAIVLNSIDVIATEDELLSERNIAETFRQVNIYSFGKPELFKATFSPLINFNKANFYCVVDRFFAFASNKETLENIIANYQNQTTLSSRDYYQNSTKNLSNEASVLKVLSSKKLEHLIASNTKAKLDANLNNYRTSAIQFVFDSHYAHVNGIIKKNKKTVEENAVTEVLNIKLDTDILNTPQFVTNHRTKQKEIVVQDINNKLYLISNTGNILWKKQLKGPVLGKIKQIDIYKNGRLQLVFATPSRVYLLDRTGKDVSGYPLKFNDEITQPISVFDYDKRKNYRLFVTQGKKVLLYDGKGKTVKGFKFKGASETINHQPQHIRIGSKDYILIKTDNNLNILSRRGETRVSVKSNLKYSKEAISKYNNTFTTSTLDGKVVSISQNGTVAVLTNSLSTNHHIATSSKTLVSQNENSLTIKGKTLELDLGNYTAPKIFYINNKIYVSVTDLQSQKVLLFDSQAKQIENFPVYGTSAIELENIDRDKNLEFVTKGSNNSILVYEIN